MIYFKEIHFKNSKHSKYISRLNSIWISHHLQLLSQAKAWLAVEGLNLSLSYSPYFLCDFWQDAQLLWSWISTVVKWDNDNTYLTVSVVNSKWSNLIVPKCQGLTIILQSAVKWEKNVWIFDKPMYSITCLGFI